MIEQVETIMSKILRIRHKQMVEGINTDIIVYMGINVWHEMMNNLIGQISSIEFSVFESNGESILSYKIFIVTDETHGIEVYEVL